MKINRGVFIGVIVIALVVGGGATYYYLQIQMARPWLPARNITGFEWLKFNQTERIFFSFGYSKGYFEGVKGTCNMVTDFTGKLGAIEPGGQAKDCLVESFSGRISWQEASERVSRFYEIYPEERDFRVEGLFRAFSAGQTIEEFLENQPEGLVLE